MIRTLLAILGIMCGIIGIQGYYKEPEIVIVKEVLTDTVTVYMCDTEEGMEICPTAQ